MFKETKRSLVKSINSDDEMPSVLYPEELLGTSASMVGEDGGKDYKRWAEASASAARSREIEASSSPKEGGLPSPHSDEENPGNALADKKHLLLTLALELHRAGSIGPRTEFLIKEASDKLGVYTQISIFPTMVLLSFHDLTNPSNSQSFHFEIKPSWNCDKLSRLDDLASRIGLLEDYSVSSAMAVLQRIRGLPVQPYLPPCRCPTTDDFITHAPLAMFNALGKTAMGLKIFSSEEAIRLRRCAADLTRVVLFGLMSMSSTSLFYGGSSFDCMVALGLGSLVGIIDQLCPYVPKLVAIELFLCSFIVAIFSFLAVHYKPQGVNACFFAQSMGSLIWLLPGLKLTVSVIELTRQCFTCGTARFFAGVIDAIQIAYGMALASRVLKVVGGFSTASLLESCKSDIPVGVNVLFFFISVPIFALFMGARYGQWPAMLLASAAGFWTSEFLSHKGFEADTSSLVAAAVIGIVARINEVWVRMYQHCHPSFTHRRHQIIGHRPLSTIIAGILVLTPGSMSIKGVMAIMTKEDPQAGLSSVITMIMVTGCIAIGLAFAQVV